jgi:hypothetical protein
MKVITNYKLINRYSKLGKYLNVAAIVILFGGMAITWLRTDLFYLSLIALFVGFILSQVSVFFINRWGRSPRPDERITSSLKGLANEFTLYHYCTPVSHLLVGPAGVWTILPYYQRGTITYEKNRWKQRGGGIGQAYLKIFAQEGIGRPDLDAKSDIEKLTDYLAKALGAEVPEIKPILVFTDKRADIQVEGAPIPTLPAEELKDYIRRSVKENTLPGDLLTSIKAILPQEEKPVKKEKAK